MTEAARLFIAVILMGVIFVLLLWLVSPAHSADLPRGMGHPKNGQAHWYDVGCCSQKDCEALPDDAVHQTQTGYRVNYIASSGFLVNVVVPFDQVRPSRDHQWHGCATQVRFLCLYGAMGV